MWASPLHRVCAKSWVSMCRYRSPNAVNYIPSRSCLSDGSSSAALPGWKRIEDYGRTANAGSTPACSSFTSPFWPFYSKDFEQTLKLDLDDEDDVLGYSAFLMAVRCALLASLVFALQSAASNTFFSSLLACFKYYFNGTHFPFSAIFQFHLLSGLERFQNIGICFQISNRFTGKLDQNIAGS